MGYVHNCLSGGGSQFWLLIYLKLIQDTNSCSSGPQNKVDGKMTESHEAGGRGWVHRGGSHPCHTTDPQDHLPSTFWAYRMDLLSAFTTFMFFSYFGPLLISRHPQSLAGEEPNPVQNRAGLVSPSRWNEMNPAKMWGALGIAGSFTYSFIP